MRTLNKIDDPQDYFKCFQELISTKRSAIIWQLDKNSHKRSIYKIIFLGCRKEDNILRGENLQKSKSFELPEEDVYFFAAKSRLIFKAPKVELEGHVFVTSLPNELKILDEEASAQLAGVFEQLDSKDEKTSADSPKKEKNTLVKGSQEPGSHMELNSTREKIDTRMVAKLSPTERDKAIFEGELNFVSLDEEDQLYAGKRDAPRARPSKGRMVTMRAADDEKDPGVYALFDLSRGGLAVLAFSEDGYASGDIVHIMGFDEKSLDNPMLAEVKSVREADEHGIQFKIGMQFVT